MERLDTNGYYALGLPLYAAIVVAELLVARRRGRRIYRIADTVGNLAAGVGEVVLGLFLGPILLWLYDFGFEHLALVRWGTDTKGSVVTWTLAFVLGDACYYGYHRAGHAVAVFWAIHGVHHQAREMNVSVALRHPWLSDVYSAPFYALLPIAGVPPAQFFVAISVISFYALTVHSHFFHRPGLFVFVTPATHIVHHAKNARYRNKNFGAMFTIWDRLFGTHVDLAPDEPPVLGTTDGYRTHDGARAQWIGFGDLAAEVRRTNRFVDKLGVLFRHPGWRPAGSAPRNPPELAREEIPRATKVYVVAQMALTVVAGAWLLWFRTRHTMPVLVVGAALVLWSLSTIGALLDGRPFARRLELVRLGMSGIAIALFWSAYT